MVSAELTVVALLTLNAVTREMAVATAGVARLLRVATTVATTEATTTAEVAASIPALGAVTRDVSDLTALWRISLDVAQVW